MNQPLNNWVLRFRSHNIVFVGDIEKAFINVEVTREDRDSLRFLWVRDPMSEDPEIAVYSFCRMVFGLNASPFLLNASLRHHISRYLETDPLFAKKMEEGFYVDDLVTGESIGAAS